MFRTDPSQEHSDLQQWRRAERRRLTQARIDLPRDTQHRYAQQIAATLEHILQDESALTIGAYCAIKGEPGLGGFMARMRARGHRIALPVVVEHAQPLVYRIWEQGESLTPGVWNIPEPPADAPSVVPDVVISPVVGFDRQCYRLGNGGGFFDRTLAALDKKPRVFGVGYAFAAMPTIHPQSYDVPMDLVITENGVFTPAEHNG